MHRQRENTISLQKERTFIALCSQNNQRNHHPFLTEMFLSTSQENFSKSPPIHCPELDLYDIQPFTTSLTVTILNGFLSFSRKLSKFYLDYVEPLYVGPQV